jgi:GDP-4-dehydro-6-deoxy-D-mannose reductase
VTTPVEVMVDPAKLRPVDMPLLVGDRTRLTNATGWVPEVPLAQTLRDILAEQRAQVRTTPNA